MENIFFYELCFNHYEDETSEEFLKGTATSFVIKTEIPNITSDVALKILSKNKFNRFKSENLTCIKSISKEEANYFFNVECLKKKVTTEFGVYYAMVF